MLPGLDGPVSVRRDHFMRSLLVALFLGGMTAVLAAPRVSFPAEGIAARYPGDRGITNDERVVFVEDFEEESLETLWKRWDTVGDRPGQSFSSDVPVGSAGKHSLVMEREKGPGAQL